MNKNPIGLFGGTFDPIHNGHIKIATDLIKLLQLQSMHFIPNKNPKHRRPIASPEHRLAMVRMAIANHPTFIVNDVEMKRPGPSYTIDTLMDIRQHLPDQPLCLILGKDAFATINTWHEWESIPDLVHLIIINRPGVSPSYDPWTKKLLQEREIMDLQKLRSTPGGYIFQHEMKPITISATEIREKLKTGLDVSQDIPFEVFQYIQKHHLYRF